jgi:hypothetical protein
MYPINNGNATQHNYTNPTAPIYLVSASAGNVEGLVKLKGNKQPYTALLDDSHFGFGLLRVENATHLNWTFYESATLAVLDSVVIVQEERWAKLQSRSKLSELARMIALES